MRWHTPLALALATSLLVACGDDDDAAMESTTTTEAAVTTTTGSTTTTAAAEQRAPGYTVTVEDPGAEPRRELRLQAEVGDVDAVTQRQETAIEMVVAGQVQSVPSSVTEMDIAYAIEEVTEEGITAVGTYEDVRVLDEGGTDPATNAQMRELLDAFRRATARTTYSTRGAIVSADLEGLDLPASAGPLLEQLTGSFVEAIESLSMPFPEEAVGSGARWRIDTATEIAGLPVEITTVVALGELTGDRASGTVDQTLRFVPGDVVVAGNPTTVVSGELRGGGPIEWDFAGGIVPRSDITTSGTTMLEVQGTPVEQSQTQRITLTAR